MAFHSGEQREITRSVATRGMRSFTNKIRTVRRVINASPDPTGLTCSFRNGIRGGSSRLAPKRCSPGKTTCSAKGEGKRSGFYTVVRARRTRKKSVVRLRARALRYRSDRPLGLGAEFFLRRVERSVSAIIL